MCTSTIGTTKFYWFDLQKKKKENNPIYSSIKNNKTLKNKFNKGRERHVHWKLQDFNSFEIKEDTSKWKDVPYSWIRRINIVKKFILPKAIYRFNVMPIKIPIAFFSRIQKTVLMYIWNHYGFWIAKVSPRKKNKAGGTTIPGFKIY